jgi:transposase-like protein
MGARQRRSSAGAPEERAGERSEPDLDGGAPAGAPGGAGADPGIPDPEVTPKARRRQFTARYKLEILEAVDAARGAGEIGVILRREGLYSSHLTKWRLQRKEGALGALGPRRRGPAPEPKNPLAGRVAELERENRRLTGRLAQAEAILGIQKKVSELLGIRLDPPESNGRPS